MHVILFDGECVTCVRWMRFIANRDLGRYRFGASQSPAGENLLRQLGLGDQAERSIVLIEDERLYLRSTAVLTIAAHLRFPWSLIGILIWVPRLIRDPIYRTYVRRRHRHQGRAQMCDLVMREIEGRLI